MALPVPLPDGPQELSGQYGGYVGRGLCPAGAAGTAGGPVRPVHRLCHPLPEHPHLHPAVLRPGPGAGGAVPAGAGEGVLRPLLPVHLPMQSGGGHRFPVQLADSAWRYHVVLCFDGGGFRSAERGRLRPAGVVLPHSGMENRERPLAPPTKIYCARCHAPAGRAGGYVLKQFSAWADRIARAEYFQKDRLL